MITHQSMTTKRLAAIVCVLALFSAACGSSEVDDSVTSPPVAETETETTTTAPESEAETATTAPDSETTTAPEPESATTTEVVEDVAVAAGCDDVAALFVTRGSANPDLADPEVSATCVGADLVITGNAIPDYTYIETSPGAPRAQDVSYTIPAIPTVAETPTAVPMLGAAAVTLGGVPIFGPTEGTGGDVDSLPGIISECGSHNGPTGFHIHKIMTSENTDCLFTPEEVAAAPQLVGYAFDGYPIYTGTEQFTSSWELTDETLFSTDTWAAHTYIEGSGDLDECNGRTDENGNYAYYTTDTFPYVVGCYTGVVDEAMSAGGGGRGGPPQDGDDERPPRDEGDDRPEPGQAPAEEGE